MSTVFEYEQSSHCSKQQVVAAAIMLESELQRLKNARTQGYATQYASINLPADHTMHGEVLAVAEQKRSLGYTLQIVIGIGGSNLGALAVYEALYGKLYNHLNPNTACYWADTVASDYIHDMMMIARRELEQGKKILLTIVSKSGRTLETEANAACFIALLREFYPHGYQQYIVVISNKDSALWDCAQRNGYTCLAIPSMVGGRYSVMSPAGLFPLACAGIDIKTLCQGAQQVIQETLHEGVNAAAAVSAAILALQYKNGIHIHDTFLFSPALENLGKWYRQLLGESIGKEYNRAGQLVEVGFMPTVSIGSTDLHAIAQRILAGPRDTFTSFVSCDSYKNTVCIGQEALESMYDAMRGKSLSVVMDALLQATLRTYQRAERPYVHYRLPAKDAYCIGEFMQWKMIETIYVGFLLGVNPFDQPAVEWYKQEARKILAHE